ncbi:unnamed protein product, partial [marine sediment metagenome]
DPIYYRIELQIFHKLDKEYPLVIMYRKDNMKDIYFTNEIVIKNRKKMISDLLTNVSFNLLEDIEYKFQFDEMGLEAYLFLKDKLEKEIEFKIKEKTPGRELASILAPIGAVNKKPEYFPIVFLNKFAMVIKKHTEIFIKIHGFLRCATEMPVQINGMKVYLAYYSLEPIISNWNNTFSGNINPIILNPPILNITNENISYNRVKCDHCGKIIVAPYQDDCICRNCNLFSIKLFRFIHGKNDFFNKVESKDAKIVSSKNVKGTEKKKEKNSEISKSLYFYGIVSKERIPIFYNDKKCK